MGASGLRFGPHDGSPWAKWGGLSFRVLRAVCRFDVFTEVKFKFSRTDGSTELTTGELPWALVWDVRVRALRQAPFDPSMNSGRASSRQALRLRSGSMTGHLDCVGVGFGLGVLRAEKHPLNSKTSARLNFLLHSDEILFAFAILDRRYFCHPASRWCRCRPPVCHS